MARKRRQPAKQPNLDHIHEQLRPLAVPIDSVNPDEANTRIHDKGSVEAIKKSLARFGQDQPIVVQKQGMVVRKGNGRLLAARELNWKHIAALIIDESDVEATLRAITDNRTTEKSRWDPSALGKAFELAQEQRVEYKEDVGFTEDEINRFMSFSTGFINKAMAGSSSAGNNTSENDPQTPPQSSPSSLPENDYVSVVFLMSLEARAELTKKLNATKTEQELATQSEALLFELGMLKRGE